ncbi:MAG: MFS transporter [Bacteroidia bacterium]|jgi:predicted MFS family arabinose efflux permease|nr:MFS transporter [Bacteroidia bacterium]
MTRSAWLAVLVATLGYFVDIYDLILFSVVREASLTDLGYTPEERLRYGVLLIDLQMIGMLVGGLLWGILADRRGRLSVLFASILTYSIANFANGLVDTIYGYSLWRVIAGIGLAGELGAGVTLVAELMPAHLRGWGTTIIATVGILGAVVASLVGEFFPWRTAYFLGGGMGIALLLLRIGVGESGLFAQLRAQAHVPMGDFFQIFRKKDRFLRYLYAILAGVPIWYVVGILVTFAPDLFRGTGLSEPVKASQAVMYAYIGLSVGDLGAGVLSQLLRSRKKPVLLWIAIAFTLAVVYNLWPFSHAGAIYLFCLFLGMFSGYWAVLITSAAEQFGTNLRATVATSVPNWIRGSLVLSTLLWQGFQAFLPLRTSALVTGIVLYGIALFSALQLRETFGASLDFVEED